MKRKSFLAGMLAIMLVFLFFGVGCYNGTTDNNSNNPNIPNNPNSGGGLSGNWGGTAAGQWVSVIITSSGWSLSTTDFSDSGTYTMSGITATLRSTVYNVETGTAVLLDSNTISVTLNSNSIMPGTYRLDRQ